MTRVLTARERSALEKMSINHAALHIKGELVGVGTKTLQTLIDLGLLETGPSVRHYGEIGWRITDDGWRCMYGETIAEIMAKPDGVKSYPFVVWRWPVDLDGRRRRF